MLSGYPFNCRINNMYFSNNEIALQSTIFNRFNHVFDHTRYTLCETRDSIIYRVNSFCMKELTVLNTGKVELCRQQLKF